MTWAGIAIAAAAVVGSIVQADAAKSAERAAERASQAGITEQQAALASFERRTQPFADIGLSARGPLESLLGIPPSANPRIAELQAELESTQATLDRGPIPIPRSGGGLLGGLVGGITGGLEGRPFRGTVEGVRGAGGGAGPFDAEALQGRIGAIGAEIGELEAADVVALEQFGARGPAGLEEINPLVSFLRDQGFADIQESAAARGRLGAGGTLQDLTQFNTQLAATVVPQLQQQRFNQLFNVLGLGANVSVGQGTAGLQTATNVSNLLGNIGQAQAQGSIAQGQIGTELISNLAGTFGSQQGGAFRGRPAQDLNQNLFDGVQQPSTTQVFA